MTFKPLLAFTACTFSAVAICQAEPARDQISLKFLSEGAMMKLGGYIPQRLELASTRPDGLKKAPSSLTAPLYGLLKLGATESLRSYYVIIDEPEDKPARLFVDSDGTGEISDNATAEWKGETKETPDGHKLTM